MTCDQKLAILTRLGSTAAAQQRDLHSLLESLGQMAKEVAQADRCSIFVYDEMTHTFWSQIAQGLEERLHVPFDKGIVGAAATDKKSIVVDDAYADSRFFDEIDRLTGYTTQTILAVPLLTQNRQVIGVFQVLNKTDGTFDDEDVQMVGLLADYAANLLENALLHAQLQERYTHKSQALSRSEKRFELISLWANDGVWDWDRASGSLYLSTRFKQILGYEEGALEGDYRLLRQLVHPDDFKVLLRSLRHHLQTREPFAAEIRMRTRTGEFRWVLARGQAQWDHAGRVIRMVGSQTDITPLKEQAQTISQLLSEQDRLITTAIHEINTPLSVIATHLEALGHRIEGSHYLPPIRSAVKILSSIYDDFRYLQNRLRSMPQPKPIDLASFVADRVAYFEDIAAAKAQKLQTKIAPGLSIRFCPTSLQRVVDNTLSNALKYSPEESTVTITLRPKGNRHYLEIADEGPGIADIARIYERHYREHDRVGGFGVGLSIVKSICDENGVIIETQNRTPTGSRFGYLFRRGP